MTRPGQVLSEAAKKAASLRGKKWRGEHPDECADYCRAYYALNHKRIIGQERARYQQNKENPEYLARMAKRQRDYYHRQKAKRLAEEEAIAAEMRSFEQQVLKGEGHG